MTTTPETPTPEQIDVVARAIYDENRPGTINVDQWDARWPESKKHYRPLAKAAISALRAAGLLVAAPTEEQRVAEREKAVIAEIVGDPLIGERAAELMREVLGEQPDPTLEDRAATPAEPGLYLDRWGNVWHLHQDGVFAMSSRIRASAARYAPFKRLVVAEIGVSAAAGVAPQEPSAPNIADEAVVRLRGLGLSDEEVRERLMQATMLAAAPVSAELLQVVLRIASTGRVTSEDLHMMEHRGVRVMMQRGVVPAPDPDREKLIAEALDEASLRVTADSYYGDETAEEAEAKAEGFNAAMEIIEAYVQKLAALAALPAVDEAKIAEVIWREQSSRLRDGYLIHTRETARSTARALLDLFAKRECPGRAEKGGGAR